MRMSDRLRVCWDEYGDIALVGALIAFAWGYLWMNQSG